jgi:hypothetical protein
VQLADPGDAPLEVRAEVGDVVAVRGRLPVVRGIVEDRLEAVVLGARDVKALVDDDPAHELALVAAPDAGLGRHDAEALVARDVRDGPSERAGREVRVAGERQVVGVARVARAERGRERGEAAIEAVRGERRERR